MNFEHVATIQQCIGNGITKPRYASLDDSTLVVMKTFNGPEGNLVLFNEYFCYRLALLLNIPMPKSGICLLDNSTKIFDDSLSSEQYGYGFYSTYTKSVTLVDTIIQKIQNKDVFYSLLLFDHVIFNTDRNPGNLLVQYRRDNVLLWVIDHSHVFINQAIWGANCLTTAMVEKDYYSTRVLEDNAFLYNMFYHDFSIDNEKLSETAGYFKSRLSKEAFCDILEDVPAEWLPSKRNTDALIDYISYRLEHLQDICITIENYLKKRG